MRISSSKSYMQSEKRLKTPNIPYQRSPSNENATRRRRSWRYCGSVLFALTVAVTFVVTIMMMEQDENIRLLGYAVHMENKAISSLPMPPLLGDGFMDMKEVAISDLTRPKRKKVKCNCFNSNTKRSLCCRRAVLRTHKFGYLLTQSLYKPFQFIDRNKIYPHEIEQQTDMKDYKDYRHVVFIRNLYDAMISGYLYHKEGKECWLTFQGWKRPGKEKVLPWEPLMQNTAPYPPGQGRSICRYLSEESETDGMRVYIEVALARWYWGILPYFQASHRQMQNDGYNKTKFVCFEDATNPLKTKDIFSESMDFLFPGGHNFSIPIKISNESYNGTHATSHDPDQRERLMDLIKSLDASVFNQTLSHLNSIFRCGNHK